MLNVLTQLLFAIGLLDSLGRFRQPLLQLAVVQKLIQRVQKFTLLKVERIQPHTIALLGDSLRVVVLVTVQRHHNHRLAKGEGFSDGVVAWFGGMGKRAIQL